MVSYGELYSVRVNTVCFLPELQLRARLFKTNDVVS